jgi:hypothetical protein
MVNDARPWDTERKAGGEAEHGHQGRLGVDHLGGRPGLAAVYEAAALGDEAHRLAEEVLGAGDVHLHHGLEHHRPAGAAGRVEGHVGAGLEGEGRGGELVVLDADERDADVHRGVAELDARAEGRAEAPLDGLEYLVGHLGGAELLRVAVPASPRERLDLDR